MRVGLVQFSPVLGDVAANVKVILSGVAEAVSAGAELVVTPEMGLTGWSLADATERARLATEVETVALPELTRAAVDRGVAIVVGGPLATTSTPHGRDPHLANAAILLEPDGSQTVYQKIHLFEQERAWWAPGREPAIATVFGARVGLTICYDAEFPEVPRMTRLAGAQLLAVAATNMTPYEHDQEVIFAARAIENECPVIVANRVGRENEWAYFGRSIIVDERGRVVGRAGSGDEVLVADIEPAALGDVALSYIRRRRPEVYGMLVEPIPLEAAAVAERKEGDDGSS